MKNYLKSYIEDNKKLLKIIGLCFALGLIVGISMYVFIDDGVKNEFSSSLKSTLDLSKKDNFEDINVIKNGLISNAILLFIIYFCTITLIAPMLVSTVVFLKSVFIGLNMQIIFSIFGFSRGIIAILCLLVIPNILYIPAFIFSTVNAIKFHYFLFEAKETNIILRCFKELFYIFISYSIIILSVVVEQLLTVNVINIYNGL